MIKEVDSDVYQRFKRFNKKSIVVIMGINTYENTTIYLQQVSYTFKSSGFFIASTYFCKAVWELYDLLFSSMFSRIKGVIQSQLSVDKTLSHAIEHIDVVYLCINHLRKDGGRFAMNSAQLESKGIFTWNFQQL